MRRLALICVLATACVAPDEAELSSTEAHVETANRLSSNALSANRLSSNRLSSNGLVAAGAVTELATTAEGRELLSYLVSCALPAGATLATTTTTGETYTFPGSLGLAPGWYDRPPTTSERRWVTACLLARTNLFGMSIKLSLRGNHPALAVGATERGQYAVFEGAFYGDLWATPRPMNTCAGYLASTDPALSTLLARQCSTDVGDGTTACGFAWTGICEQVCRTSACKDRDQTEWTEVISVYLERP